MKFTKGRFIKKPEQAEQEPIVKQAEPKFEMQFIPREESKQNQVTKVFDDEIVSRGVSYTNSICVPRVAGSKQEREIANNMLVHSEEVLDHKGTIEPFYVAKSLHKYGLLLFSVLFLIILVTFPFSPISAFIVYLFSISALALRVFFKVDLLGFFGKDISFNVVNEIKKSNNFTNTLIVTSNYSTSCDYNINRFFKVNIKAFYITMIALNCLAFIMFVVLVAGVNSVAVKVITGLLIATDVVVLALFYGNAKNLNSKNGLSGVNTSLLIMDYLNNHKGLIGDNTKVVFCSFGGGTDSTKGAKEFVKQHFTNNDDYPNAVVVDLNCTKPVKPTIYTGKNANKLANSAYEKLCIKGFNKERALLKGGAVKEFNRVGVDCVSFGDSTREIGTDFNTANDNSKQDKTESMENFYTYLDVVTDILNKLKN